MGIARVAVACLVVGAAACGPPESAPEPASTVSSLILAPMEGDSVELPVTIQLSSTGVAIAAATGLREEGIAHHHLLLNVDHSPDSEPIPAGNGYIHLGSGASEWVLDSLPPGTHRIIARLAWGDHVPIPSAGTDTVVIVVR